MLPLSAHFLRGAFERPFSAFLADSYVVVNLSFYLSMGAILTKHADHVGLHDGLAKLLINSVAGDHLVAIGRVNIYRQVRPCNPAAVGIRCL